MKNTDIVSPLQVEHALKVAQITGQTPERDAALLLVAYGTGLMPIELAKITISDFLEANGKVRAESSVREEIAFNGQVRPLFWSNQRVISAVEAYLAERIRYGFGMGTEGAFRGLAPDSTMFLAADGKPFAFTKRVTKAGTLSYSCESLTQIIRRLHTQAGIASGSALSARKSFMVRLAQAGIDARHIKACLGVQSLTSIHRVTDKVSVDLGKVTALAI